MSMDKKKRSVASNAAFYLLAVVGIIVAVNLISTRVFGRLDLTDAKVYTLSPASKDVVRDLKDYVNVKAYVSETLPAELKSLSRYVRDLLDEYRSNSKGKFRFEAVDPTADKKLEDEASNCGVHKLQIQKLEDQKFEVGAYYLGLCIQYNGQNEAIPEIVGAEGLEYQVSSLVKRMTQKKRKLAVTNGHGELDLTQGFQALQHVVAQEFDTTTVNPSSAAIADDVDALLVGGPKQAFDDKGRKEIDAFLMKGKGAIFLVDGMAMSTPKGNMGMEAQGAMPKMGQANDSGLSEILKAYGFSVGQDFVLDGKQNAPGPVDVGGGRRMLANAPMFVGVEMEKAGEKDFSLTGGINAMVFPYASSVELVGPLQGGKATRGRLMKIAQSSRTSWRTSGFFMFSPGTKLEEAKEAKDKGPFALGYAYEGPLRSAYAPAAPANVGMSGADTAGESKKKVRLLVMGDSDFASDEYFPMSRYLPIYGNGAQFLLNAIGWALEDEALAPVRAKTVTSRPIQLDPDQKVAVIKAFNILGIPLAFCAFGIFRWRVRRSRRQGQKL
jgi:gliding-associated putative ABC transporter substrate-binding component GldG